MLLTLSGKCFFSGDKKKIAIDRIIAEQTTFEDMNLATKTPSYETKMDWSIEFVSLTMKLTARFWSPSHVNI